jgi:hypothetical protein
MSIIENIKENLPDDAFVIMNGSQLKAFLDQFADEKEQGKTVSLQGTAKILGISPQKVYRLRNKIGGYQLSPGGAWQFDRKDIYAFKQKRKAA